MGSTSSKAARHPAKMGVALSGRRFWRVLERVKGLKQFLERGQVGFSTRRCVMMIAENQSRTVRGMAAGPNRKSRIINANIRIV